MYVRGSLEISYQSYHPIYRCWRGKILKQLPIWRPMRLNSSNIFFFIALGISTQGFRLICRLTLCVDGSFLKHKYEGSILVAIVLDTNNQLYYAAFGE